MKPFVDTDFAAMSARYHKAGPRPVPLFLFCGYFMQRGRPESILQAEPALAGRSGVRPGYYGTKPDAACVEGGGAGLKSSAVQRSGWL
jgi:hypothetical protein